MQIFMATYLLSRGDSMVFANSYKVRGLPPGEYDGNQNRIEQNKTSNYFLVALVFRWCMHQIKLVYSISG